MSRILRRPMFRGGRVSSYGTGIASGLADGGRVNYEGGGQIGGGIIYGKPMADGRYGFEEPTVVGLDLLKKNVPSSMWDMTSDEALKMAESYGYKPEETVDTEWVTDEGQKIYGVDSPHGLKPTFDLSSMGIGQQTWEGMDEYIYRDAQGDQVVKTDVFEREEAPTDKVKEYAEKHDLDVSQVKAMQKEGELGQLGDSELAAVAAEKGVETEDLVWRQNMSEDGTPLKGGEWVVKGGKKKKSIGDLEIEKLRAEIAQLRKDGMGGESMDIDAETYLKALGGDKAMGQDISDMLLSAGSKFLKPGATVKGGFSEFLGDEAKKGPGRLEKLEQAAAMLAIKDSIASKRSTEQLEKLLGIETFRSKLGSKNLAENITLAGKTYNPGSVKAIEMGFKMTYPTAIIIRQPDANYTPDPGDEGKYILEEDTKTVWKITDGNKQKVW